MTLGMGCMTAGEMKTVHVPRTLNDSLIVKVHL